jgi:hypothetical protein
MVDEKPPAVKFVKTHNSKHSCQTIKWPLGVDPGGHHFVGLSYLYSHIVLGGQIGRHAKLPVILQSNNPPKIKK